MNFKAAFGAFAIWCTVANIVTAPLHDIGAGWALGTLAAFLASLMWLQEYARDQPKNKGDS